MHDFRRKHRVKAVAAPCTDPTPPPSTPPALFNPSNPLKHPFSNVFPLNNNRIQLPQPDLQRPLICLIIKNAYDRSFSE